MARAIKILVVVGLVVFVGLPLASRVMRSGKAPLTAEEQQVWERLLGKHLSTTTVTPREEDADAVAAIGDKIVPYIESQFGNAAGVPGTFGKSEYWLIIVLARIGSPQAIDAVVKVLEHDFPGNIETDRETAAKALVWLGATDRVSYLEAAIAAHEQAVAQSSDPERYGVAVDNLKQYLELLKKGEGKRDKSKFPFGPSLIKDSIWIPTPQ